jgi:hypothetical protein
MGEDAMRIRIRIREAPEGFTFWVVFPDVARMEVAAHLW